MKQVRSVVCSLHLVPGEEVDVDESLYMLEQLIERDNDPLNGIHPEHQKGYVINFLITQKDIDEFKNGDRPFLKRFVMSVASRSS